MSMDCVANFSRKSECVTATKSAQSETIVSQTATNLRAFRTFFAQSNEDDETFKGFDDKDPLVQVCNSKSRALAKNIRKIEQKLNKKPLVKENQNSPSSKSINAITTAITTTTTTTSTVADPVLPSSPSPQPAPLKIELTTTNIPNKTVEDFVGFDENDPLRLELQRKQKILHEIRKKLQLGMNHNNGDVSLTKIDPKLKADIGKTIINHMDSMDLDAPSDSESEGSTVKKQMKRLLPNDEQNFIKVKGARVKQVCHTSGYVKKLPMATFGHNTLSNGSGLNCRTVGDAGMKYIQDLLGDEDDIESSDEEENGSAAEEEADWPISSTVQLH